MLIIGWTPKHTADTKVHQTSGPHRAFYRELNIWFSYTFVDIIVGYHGDHLSFSV